MIVNFIRTIVMYLFVTMMLRLMGKRQIGELEASELVVTIIVSQLACIPIQQSSESLLNTFIGIFTIVSCEIISSFLAFKSPRLRTLMYGTPSILIEKGKMNKKEMEEQRFNVNDLMEELRNRGIYNLSEVDYVIMETNGSVSVILNSENRPATPGDLKIKDVEPVELSYVIVDSGNIDFKNLNHIGYDKIWLQKKLRENKIKNLKEVFFMSADRAGKVYLIKS